MALTSLQPACQLDVKLAKWESGSMKVTLDLPSDLVREMKLEAVHQGRKLKDVAAEIFRRGLSLNTPPSDAFSPRMKIPLIECRHAATPAQELTGERVADILLHQDVEAFDEASGR